MLKNNEPYILLSNLLIHEKEITWYKKHLGMGVSLFDITDDDYKIQYNIRENNYRNVCLTLTLNLKND